MCLDIAVDICPPQRHDLKPFVERFNRTLEYECPRPAHPQNLEATHPVIQQFKQFYNQACPHQGLSFQNRPPFVTFPERLLLRPLPQKIDPNHWLQGFDNTRFKRRVTASGTVMVNNFSYCVGRQFKGRQVLLKLDAQRRCFVVEFDGTIPKSLPINGLYQGEMRFEDYFEWICQEACSAWRRLRQAAYRRFVWNSAS
jgi:hypothetical protein